MLTNKIEFISVLLSSLLTCLVSYPEAGVTDRVVGPEVEVEFVAGRDVAGRSVVSTEPAHQRSLWLPALPDLQHVVLTAVVSLQLKVEKLYLDPAMINNL